MARKRGNLWQADVRTPEGNRLRPTFKTKEAAEAWESATKLAIQEGKPYDAKAPLPRRRAHRDLSLLGTLFDFTKKTEWDGQKAGETLARNGRIVMNHLGANTPVADITSGDIADMKVAFAQEGLSPSTVNRRVAALSKMLRIALDNEVIDKLPRIRWNKVEKTRFRFLDEREERILLNYWKAENLIHVHDLTILLIDTGARCYSEMIPARWDAFGPGFKTVTFWHTKTNRPRTVPLTSRSQKIVKDRHKEFGDKTGPFWGLNKNTMQSRWENMRAATGLEGVTPHVMRHTCCTRLVLGGVDVKRVMEWMGHDTISTTMRYMQIKPSSLEDALKALERDDRQAA